MYVDPQHPEPRELRFAFRFKREDVTLDYSLIGVVVHATGCVTVGRPGSPALPTSRVRVALPPSTRLRAVEAEARETAMLTEGPVPIAPLQPLRPAIGYDDRRGPPPYRRPEEQARDYDWKADDLRREQPSADRFPVPPFVPLDADEYVKAIRRPRAEVVAVAHEGLTSVATIELRPVRLTPKGELALDVHIELTLALEPIEPQERVDATPIVSRAQAMRQIALTRMTVLNPREVFDFSDLYQIVGLGTDYLIITDNQQWDAAAMAPLAPAGGDLVATFERLADWKTQRGLRARVVTISDIVAGVHGGFRGNARDLQEVIRNFLKMAQARWGVAWVLLGGDTDIVPIRRAASDALGGVTRQGVNPPPPNSSCWTGTALRIHATNLGDWWGASPNNLLVRRDNGLLIPYDAAGTSGPASRGWFFTTDNTYATQSATPTAFVRVNGPASEVNADLQFLYEWNTIPTDLYYSSLVGPRYNQPGLHDWDLTNNGVYGQHADVDLDGVNFTPTVSLGRASVGTADEAAAFVDKVIAYEKLEHPDGTRLDVDWLRSVVIVSENWGGRLWIGASSTNPPGNNGYHHPAGAAHTLIKLETLPDWNWSLLAYVAEGDVRLLPYRTDAAGAGRGWYFATSATDLSPNVFLVAPPGGGLIALPQPSPWIAVFGSSDELAPVGFVFNHTQLDGSLADQEGLRVQLRTEMAGFDRLSRLYEDIEDMSPAAVGAAPLSLITTDRLRDALNAAPHIVSLSGHGNSNGCCKLSRAVASALTNGYRTFIAYADSCLTNQLDDDAMSERLIGNPDGGAVAYIGNTRFSWIGVGDDYQRRFFREWATLAGDAHLGLLCDTRATLMGGGWWDRWAVLALNLTGDPEMPLWWRKPFTLCTPIPVFVNKLLWVLEEPPPPEPVFTLPYVKNWNLTWVHVQQGRQQALAIAQADGRVEIPLDGFAPGHAVVTVSRAGHQPLVQNATISFDQTGDLGQPPGERVA